MSYVKITAGSYRNVVVDNEIFPVIKGFTDSAVGGFITVNGTSKFGIDAAKIRIKVASQSMLEFVDEETYLTTGAVTPMSIANVVEVTDEQRIIEIGERFEILDDMTKAALNGDIRAMIVSGPPGVGKSFTVERELEKAAIFDQISGRRVKSTIIKGSATAIGLYKVLYEYSDSNCVVVFDDADNILFDDVSLNLLKGALDSGKKRKISWLSESRALKNEGVPNSFTFNGSVIFITNMKFDQVRSVKLKDHLEALQSRCHYLDLTIDTLRDKILRIKQIAATGLLFADYNFEQCVQDEIIEFMDVNKHKVREMSLRMAIKIAELRKSFPHKWQSLANTTCMKSN